MGKDARLSNSMGLFLQKTNIIRDYLEDSLDGREFWPREVSFLPPWTVCAGSSTGQLFKFDQGRISHAGLMGS